MPGLTRTMMKLALVAGFRALVPVMPAAMAQDMSAESTHADIVVTLGSLPGMFSVLPDAGIAAARAEFKSIQLNPRTALDGKTKELLVLGGAAQIPCQYCVYFHTKEAKLSGATDEEVREAVAMSAIVRHWSTVLNGMQVDPGTFGQEIDAVFVHATK